MAKAFEKKEGRVVVIGPQGLIDEIKLAGFSNVTGLELEEPEHKSMNDSQFGEHETDPTVIAIVYTFDPNWSFRTLAIANIYLSTRPDVKFVATNDDCVFSTGSRLIPDVGSLLVAQEVASGREAEKVGKPSPFGFQIMQEEHG